MECQGTTKNLKINKNKAIGTVVVVVEGEDDEFRLLKHIFTKILDYNYVSMKRNKVIQHGFYSKTNKNNTIIVANTSNSSINTITDDEKYKDKLFTLLKKEYDRNLKNTPIYILWDRDKDTAKDEYYKNAINNFSNAQDNNYEMNGLLLLSYPCYECYALSNFDKRLWHKNFKTSMDAKKTFNMSKYTIKDINEKTLLIAAYNMHKSLFEYGVRSYDPSNFKNVNNKVFRKEQEFFNKNKSFNALSLISIMLVDLGIIFEDKHK